MVRRFSLFASLDPSTLPILPNHLFHLPLERCRLSMPLTVPTMADMTDVSSSDAKSTIARSASSTTTPGTAIQPSAQVFATPELLELVLLLVPTKTLLSARRVNKTWRCVIKTSTRLQEALSLNPSPEPLFSRPAPIGLLPLYFDRKLARTGANIYNNQARLTEWKSSISTSSSNILGQIFSTAEPSERREGSERSPPPVWGRFFAMARP